MRYFVINILRSPIRLFRRAGTTINGRIDAPDSSTLVDALFAHQVLIFSPMAFLVEPQSLVHGLQDSLRLLFVGRRIFAQKLGHASSQLIATIVIG